MRDARPGGSANHHGIAAEVRIRHRREDAVFLVSHMNEFDLPIAPQRVDHRIERIPHNAVTTLTPAVASMSHIISATFCAIGRSFQVSVS